MTRDLTSQAMSKTNIAISRPTVGVFDIRDHECIISELFARWRYCCRVGISVRWPVPTLRTANSLGDPTVTALFRTVARTATVRNRKSVPQRHFRSEARRLGEGQQPKVRDVCGRRRRRRRPTSDRCDGAGFGGRKTRSFHAAADR